MLTDVAGHPTHNIESLCERAHTVAKEKGWLDKPRPYPLMTVLMQSELSEALEDYRAHRALDEVYYEDTNGAKFATREAAEQSSTAAGSEGAKPAGIPVELADFVIRVCQQCGTEGWTGTLVRYISVAIPVHTPSFELLLAVLHLRVSQSFLAYTAAGFLAGDGKVQGLADALNALFSFCKMNGIDIWAAIEEKEKYNAGRSYRHGGKKA
jgi:hypothetical protein